MRISDWSSDVCSSDLMSDAAINRSFDFVLTNPGHYVNLELSVGASRIATIAQGRHSINSLSLGSAVLAKADRGDLIDMQDQIGRASCRERVCQYVLISEVAVTLKKKKIKKRTE